MEDGNCPPGRPWIASLAYGAQSLAFPETLSAAAPGWALACILWGAAYAGLVVQRTQRVD